VLKPAWSNNECVSDALSIWVAVPLEGRLALLATRTAGG